jgi:arylsulfatase A-like enzyme
MSAKEHTVSFYIKRTLLYVGAGLLLDSLISFLYGLSEILDMLNLSRESILDLTPALFSGIIALYLFTFALAGLFITLFLLLIRFLYRKHGDLKKFLWVKLDVLLTGGLLLLPVIFIGFYFDSDGNVPYRYLFPPALFYLALSLMNLYFRSGFLRWALYACRLAVLAVMVPAFLFQILTNASIERHRGPLEPDRAAGVTSADLKDLNVLLITIDTCRADKMSSYGFGKDTTPHIDRLSERGFVFDFAFSSSNWTKPATASLLTSVYSGTHQTNTLVQRLPESLVSLPERFKKAGYHTAILSANANLSPDFGFDQGVDYFFEASKKSMILFSVLYMRIAEFSPYLGKKLQRFKRRERISGETTEEEAIYTRFMAWLDGIGRGRFFANLHFNTPHADYDPPPEYDVFTEDKTVQVLKSEPAKSALFTDAQLKRLLALYYGEIYYVDSVIGKIIERMEEDRLMEKTVIVITADHGEEFYDHRGWGHSHSMYNELLHIPMIFYVPGHPNAPARIPHPVSIVDIGPTLMSLAGFPPDPFMDGKDLTALLSGDGTAVRDYIFAESLSPLDDIAKYTIIKDGFKLIEYKYPDEKMEALFDLNRDFKEKKRLPLKLFPQYEELKRHLAAMKQYVLDKKQTAGTVTLSPEKKEQLRELGYLE